MLEQEERRRRVRTVDARSYAVTMAILTVYAALASIIVMRSVLVALDATESVWMGRFVFGITSRVTDFMAEFPGATREILGPLNVIDLSLLAVVLLFPLGLVATSGTLKR